VYAPCWLFLRKTELTWENPDPKRRISRKTAVKYPEELLDNKLVGYGLSDAVGTRCVSIDGMIAKFEKKQTQKPPEQHRRR